MSAPRRSLFLFSTACTALSLSSQAQDAPPSPEQSLARSERPIEELVIVGARTPVAVGALGSAVTVIDAQRLDALQVPIVSDILRDVPGLAVNRSGVPGGLTEVRIRGAEANQTLVLIDGIEANDPAGDAAFSFANLLTTDIERIEVLRGPQSALFGSEAIGGVINVVTKAGEPGLHASAEVQGGSFGTRQVAGSLSGGVERLTARIGVGFFENEGVNNALTGTEQDSFQNLTLNGKVRAQPLDNLTIEGAFRYFDGESDFDAFNASPLPPTPELVITDADNRSFEEEILARGAVTLDLFGGALSQFAAVEFGDYENTSASVFGDFVSEFIANADRFKVKYQSTGRLSTGSIDHTLTGAIEYEEIDFLISGTDQTDDQLSLVGEYRFAFDERLFVTAGVRHDFNDLFQDSTNYRVTGAYWHRPTQTRLHGSWGTGIINPTFFELFGFNPDFTGNPDLTPEEAESFDIGVEQRLLGGRVVAGITYFRGELTDEIVGGVIEVDGVPVFSSVNQLGESDRQGVEVSVSAELLQGLTVRGAYTYTDAEDPDGGPEIRRADHIASANINYVFLDGRGTVNLGVDYNGEQEDLFFNEVFASSLVTLDSFVLVNLAASYRFDFGLEVFGRIENLTDSDYSEVFGFNSSGIGAFGGVRFSF